MNVFPSDSSGANFGSHVQVYADSNCRVLASVSDPSSGKPLPQAQVAVINGRIQPFSCSQAVVYVRDNSGNIQALYPSSIQTKPTVTGSKGGNAALTSLISTLAGLGIITDSTT